MLATSHPSLHVWFHMNCKTSWALPDYSTIWTLETVGVPLHVILQKICSRLNFSTLIARKFRKSLHSWMSCERVIHKAPLSLEAFSTLIAQNADSVGDHVAFQQPCRSLLLSTNLTGERSFSSVKSSSTAVTCDQMFATCVENNQIFVPTSENTWNYESGGTRQCAEQCYAPWKKDNLKQACSSWEQFQNPDQFFPFFQKLKKTYFIKLTMPEAE